MAQWPNGPLLVAFRTRQLSLLNRCHRSNAKTKAEPNLTNKNHKSAAFSPKGINNITSVVIFFLVRGNTTNAFGEAI